MSTEGPDAADKRHFASTHWSLVLAAGRRGSPESREALATLCATYWYPLYCFVRREGYQPAEAADLTQGFFARLLEKQDVIEASDPQRGTFRSFLLASLRHYLSNERDCAKAQKRGGGSLPLPLDFESGEARFCHQPAHELTAERLFERDWALALLDRVLVSLRAEHVDLGREAFFDAVKVFLSGHPPTTTYMQLASDFGITEAAVKQAVHRLRRRYRERLRAEIGQTVAGPEEIEAEIHDLFWAVSI